MDKKFSGINGLAQPLEHPIAWWLVSPLIFLAFEGCASQTQNTALRWDVKHVVERTSSSSSPNACDLKITTYNNTNEPFLGVNTQFVLLDGSGRVAADLKYFVDGSLLPGYGLSVARTVAKDCADLVAMKVLYLTLPVPTGYYHPRILTTDVR